MAGEMVTAAFAIGVGILAVALLFTPVMDFTTTDSLQYLEVDNGSEKSVNDNLNVSALDVNQTNATLELENTNDFNSSSKTLDVNQNATYNLSNDKLKVNLTEITVTDTTARVSVQYPPTFGFDPLVATFYENLDTLIALIGFVLVTFPLVVILVE